MVGSERLFLWAFVWAPFPGRAGAHEQFVRLGRTRGRRRSSRPFRSFRRSRFRDSAEAPPAAMPARHDGLAHAPPPFVLSWFRVRSSTRPDPDHRHARLTDPLVPASFPGSLEGGTDEAVVSSAQQAPDRKAWISRPHGGPLGPRRSVASPEEGSEAARRLASVEARELLTPSERLGRAHRLARASEIRRCLARGRRRRTEHLDMIWADNMTGHPRMGLIVPKFRATAVARNRLRRRLREIWRREILPQQPATDLIIRARREAYEVPFAELRRQLLAWRDATLAR